MDELESKSNNEILFEIKQTIKMAEIKDDLENMSNNEILFQIKQYEADHEALKLKMLQDYDKMVEIELKFDRANQILLKRLKGE